MSKTPKRTIGKLETWESEDKTFSKHLLSEGVGDTTPSEGSVCTVMINFIDAIEIPQEKLGSYIIAEEVEVTIGEGDTPLSELFDRVLCSMKEKETSYIKAKVDVDGKKFDTPAQSQDFVPSLSKSWGESLKFNVVLKSISREANVTELEVDEKIERAQHHKDKGTELFRIHKTDFAIKRYLKATAVLDHLDSDENKEMPACFREQARTLRVQCYNNLGACYLKEAKLEEVVQVEDQALAVEADNAKALFRRGQAYSKLNRYREAKADFLACLQVEPDNAAAKNQLRDVEAKIKREKDMYAKMFQSKASSS